MNYWDKRYASGGTSGCGSVGELRDIKWCWIKQFVDPITDIIDVGCGDLSFWEYEMLPERYVGIDSSEVIIKKNQLAYPGATFYHAQSSEPLGITSPVVFCFDMMFHIMDDDVYQRTIQNLCILSSEYIFIYTWIENPLRWFWIIEKTKDKYECFRGIEGLNDIMEANSFTLIAIMRSEWVDPFGAMLIFRKTKP